MTTFTARWIAIERRHPQPTDFTHRAVCGMPAGCPGELGLWCPLLPDRLGNPRSVLPFTPWTYYVKDGENRYRLLSGRQRPHAWRRPGSRPDPRPAGSWAPARPIVRGREPTIPTTIVCPVCGRDNAIALAPNNR